MAGQTAYEGLIDIGKLEAGQTILINGGSSAVGAFAIQIAKAIGAKVVATASGRNEEFVRGLGADEVCSSRWSIHGLADHIYSSLTTPKDRFMNT